MKRISIALATVAVAILGATCCTAQSMDDLNLYSTSDNFGLKPNSRMTLVKLGVSF